MSRSVATLDYYHLAEEAKKMKFQEFKKKYPQECEALGKGNRYGAYQHYVVLRGFGARIVMGEEAAYAFKYMKEPEFGEKVAIPVLLKFLEFYAKIRYNRMDLLGANLSFHPPYDFAVEIILKLDRFNVPENPQRKLLYLKIRNEADNHLLSCIENAILEKTGYLSEKRVNEILESAILNKQEFIKEINSTDLPEEDGAFVKQVYSQIKIDRLNILKSVIKRYIEGNEVAGEILSEILACESCRDEIMVFPESGVEDQIEYAISNLPIGEREKNIFKMYIIDGLTLEEIGKGLGISRQRVSQIINRGEVKKRLGEYVC